MVNNLRTEQSLLPTSQQFLEAIGFMQFAMQHARAAYELDNTGMFSHHAKTAIANLERAAAALDLNLTPRLEGKDARAP